MVSSDASWLAPHIKIYQDVLAYLNTHPPMLPASDYLLKFMPAMYRQCYGAVSLYVGPNENGTVVLRPAEDGNTVMYWNGRDVDIATYSEQSYRVGDFITLANKIAALSGIVGHSSPLVLDLGAGTCGLAIGIRVCGHTFPIVNLEYFSHALAIGRKMADTLGLTNIVFAHVDINGALSGSKDATQDFKSTILKYAGGRPIIVVSRLAIHPFYSVAEYERLLNFVIDDLDAKAGIHLEMCGYQTEAYRKVCSRLGKALPISNKIKNEPGDPLRYLENLPQIKVLERSELWPQYISGQWHSYLSWIRK